ncbi:hypothetical protein MTO96_038263 [Rhipicephalus appendiculatus]
MCFLALTLLFVLTSAEVVHHSLLFFCCPQLCWRMLSVLVEAINVVEKCAMMMKFARRGMFNASNHPAGRRHNVSIKEEANKQNDLFVRSPVAQASI